MTAGVVPGEGEGAGDGVGPDGSLPSEPRAGAGTDAVADACAAADAPTVALRCRLEAIMATANVTNAVPIPRNSRRVRADKVGLSMPIRKGTSGGLAIKALGA
jgi:hypothetical protein